MQTLLFAGLAYEFLPTASPEMVKIDVMLAEL